MNIEPVNSVCVDLSDFWNGPLQNFDVPAQKATVVDTVGAGDTFSAGFMAQLHKSGHLTKDGLRAASETDLRTAAAIGAKVAAITVSRAGANPPWASEL